MERLNYKLTDAEIKDRLRRLTVVNSDEDSLFLAWLANKYGILAIDIDGVLCEERRIDYSQRKSIFFNFAGHKYKYKILYTARLAKDRKTTEEWLKEHSIRYDALITNKLPYSMLIDDKAQQPNFHREHLNDAQSHAEVNSYIRQVAMYLSYFVKEHDRILDVGASDGEMAKYMPANYTGIDISPASKMVKKATIYDIKDRYDLIIYNHVLEHIKTPYEEIQKAASCLKKGGSIFVACPTIKDAWAWELQGHYCLLNYEIVKKIAEFANLSIVEYSTHCLRADHEEQWIILR